MKKQVYLNGIDEKIPTCIRMTKENRKFINKETFKDGEVIPLNVVVNRIIEYVRLNKIKI
jgi:hypothetical protein